MGTCNGSARSDARRSYGLGDGYCGDGGWKAGDLDVFGYRTGPLGY